MLNEKETLTGLELLRKPFPDHQISKLPKPTKQQSDKIKENFKNGIRCQLCGGWHHPQVVHLDYVGHAALTDRLLDVDPGWTWKPMSLNVAGLPCFDDINGLWIELTILGQTRLGYGSAGEKKGGDAIKEIIGDALRNAAMRFGAALDLWHKGDLHGDDDLEDKIESTPFPPLDMSTVDSQVGIKFMKGKFKTAMDAIKYFSESRTVTLKNEARIQELWSE